MSNLRATADVVIQASKSLGAPLPEPIAAAYELTKVPPVSIVAPTPLELGAALGAAVAAGRDPVTDKTVVALVIRQSLVAMLPDQQIADYRADLLGTALVDNADAIVDSWRQSVAADAEALTAARLVLGDDSLDNPPRHPRPVVAAAWAQATAASQRFDLAAKRWWLLADAANVDRNPHRRALVFGPVTLEQFRTLPAKPTAWECVCAGVDLDLATFETWRRRNQALEDEVTAEVNAVEARRKLTRPSLLP